MDNFTSSRQARAHWKSGRALPCGCRVKGTGHQPTAIVSCDTAQQLERAVEDAFKKYGFKYERVDQADVDAHRVALEALWAHRRATPIYKGGR